ncbi:MAG: HAD-IIIA family hydrolase [Clostridia bacterium]|nr:HAD-IIIA family hydrolase [Clostridia bacterium]
MYKTIIFDLDGTLLDTLDDLTSSTNYALQTFGFPARTRDEIREFVGHGIRNLIERAIGSADHPQFEAVFEAFKTHYGAHCSDQTRPYDGVLELLAMLKKAGKRLAVLSNKADFAVKTLAKEYFGALLEEAVGANEAAGIRKKPAPDALFSLMDKFGVSAEETVYVGDSEVDVETAKNAGVACVSVTWGFRSKTLLSAAGAKTFADTPETLFDLLIKE